MPYDIKFEFSGGVTVKSKLIPVYKNFTAPESLMFLL